MDEENLNEMEDLTPENPTPEMPDSEAIQGSTKSGNFFQRKIDNMKSRTKNNLRAKRENLQESFENSPVGKLAEGMKNARHSQGIKNKMKALGRGAKNSIKSTKAAKKLAEKLKALAKWFKKNWKLIVIISATFTIVSLIFTTVCFFIGLSQASGPSPHYYCTIDASKELKKSALYKQYCTDSSRDVDENGIPVVPYMRQGSGGWIDPDVGTFGAHDYHASMWPGSSDPMGPDSCGPSAASMVLSYFSGEMFFPDSQCFMQAAAAGRFNQSSEWEDMNGDRPYGNYTAGGTGWGAQILMAKIVGEETGIIIETDFRTDFSIENLDEILADGNMCVLLAGAGSDVSGSIQYDGNVWTSGGHYIAVIGKLPDGTYAVAESGGSGQRSYWGTRYWNFEEKHSVRAEAFTSPGTCVSSWLVYYNPDNT